MENIPEVGDTWHNLGDGHEGHIITLEDIDENLDNPYGEVTLHLRCNCDLAWTTSLGILEYDLLYDDDDGDDEEE